MYASFPHFENPCDPIELDAWFHKLTGVEVYHFCNPVSEEQQGCGTNLFSCPYVGLHCANCVLKRRSLKLDTGRNDIVLVNRNKINS
jgi:hypothetical protein